MRALQPGIASAVLITAMAVSAGSAVAQPHAPPAPTSRVPAFLLVALVDPGHATDRFAPTPSETVLMTAVPEPARLTVVTGQSRKTPEAPHLHIILERAEPPRR